MNEDEKRVFFGVEVEAPWPEHLPTGRFLDEKHRHLTLFFLGNIAFPRLQELLPKVPKPRFKVGQVGYFDEGLFLPNRRPNVVAWHAIWQRGNAIETYQKELADWLASHDYPMERRPWLPHVTLCRWPFDPKKWAKAFQKLPLITGSIHLYESKGNLTYEPIWSCPVQRPFVEIEHTADMAFDVYGETFEQLYDNAFTALAFKHPALLAYGDRALSPGSLDEVIRALNGAICVADGDVGCPMKAVSFHGQAVQRESGIYHWEMIVDV